MGANHIRTHCSGTVEAMSASELTPTARMILERARHALAPITVRALPYECWRWRLPHRGPQCGKRPLGSAG